MTFKINSIKPKAFLPAKLNNFLNSGNERSVRAKRNILFSFILKGGNILIGLLLVPLTINYVSATQYGIWLTLSSIVAWFSFFDIGFGNGLRNKFAEATALGKHKLARIYVSTTYAVLTIIVLAVLLVFFCINPFLNWSVILNAPAPMENELSLLALLVFAFFSLQFILQLITVVLTANQQPAKATLFNFYGKLIAIVAIFILTKTTSGNLIYLAISLGLSPIIILAICNVWFYHSAYRKYSPSFKFVRFRFARNLMGLGIKFFLIQISGIVLYSTDNVIISQMFGPDDVTPYNLAHKYFSTLTVVFSIVLTPFWSAITEAYTKNDVPWIRRSMNGLMKLSGLFIILVIVMVIFADWFYNLWVGDKVHVPQLLTITMAIYFSLVLFLQPFTFFINGAGKIKFQLIQSVLVALINIPLAIYFAKNSALGVSGIIIATIVCFIPSAVLTPIQYIKIIKGNARGIWNA